MPCNYEHMCKTIVGEAVKWIIIRSGIRSFMDFLTLQTYEHFNISNFMNFLTFKHYEHDEHFNIMNTHKEVYHA